MGSGVDLEAETLTLPQGAGTMQGGSEGSALQCAGDVESFLVTKRVSSFIVK